MTILVYFHSSGFRNFKIFYKFLSEYFFKAFPNLPSYNRFIEIMKRVVVHLILFSQINSGKRTGINYCIKKVDFLRENLTHRKNNIDLVSKKLHDLVKLLGKDNHKKIYDDRTLKILIKDLQKNSLSYRFFNFPPTNNGGEGLRLLTDLDRKISETKSTTYARVL